MSLPKVQQKAIDRLRDGSMTIVERRELLKDAASKGWAPVLRAAIKEQEPDDLEVTLHRLLRLASEAGRDHVETVKVLISAGADPNGKDILEHCGIKSLPVLVAAGGNVDGTTGKSPLLTSIARRTKEDKALALIAAGANVNQADQDGQTPLMLAAEYGRTKVFDALLAEGADEFAVDNAGRSAMRHAMESLAFAPHATNSDRKGCQRIIRRLREDLPTQPEDILLVDIALDDAQALKKKLATGLEPDAMIAGDIGSAGKAWSQFFVADDRPQNTKDALRKGVKRALSGDFDKQPAPGKYQGATLLMWAVLSRSLKCVKTLVESEANPDSEGIYGITARKLANDIPVHARIRALFDNGSHSDDTAKVATDRRTERLDIVPDEAKSFLDRSLQSFESLRDKFSSNPSICNNPSVCGSLTVDAWEFVSICHVLDARHESLREWCVSCIEYSKRFFFGDWRTEYRPPDGSTSNANLYLRAELEWVEPFSVGLAAAAMMHDWDSVEQLCQYPDVDCCRPYLDRQVPDTYDWIYWVMFSQRVRGNESWTEAIPQIAEENGGRTKVLLEIDQAIREANDSELTKAIGKLIRFHRSRVISRKYAPNPAWILSPHATFLIEYARHCDVSLSCKPAWQNFVGDIASG